MQRSQKRLLAFLGALPVVLVLAALAYMLGMYLLEGESRSFWRSLEFAAETVSTTGYGADSEWTHPVMVVFVVVLQYFGVLLIFLIFPIYLIPVLEERFERRLPTSARPRDDEVLIYHYGPPVETLIEEVERAGLPAVIVEEDTAEARRLLDRGLSVVHGSLEDGVLSRVGLERARALVANARDDENASVILAARELDFRGEILAIAEDPFHRKPLSLAGANAVFTPRHILGAALAAWASERISPRVMGVQALGLGPRLLVNEFRIDPASELVGKTLRDADIGRTTGVTVLGQWVLGRLVALPTADMVLEPNGILIVAGSAESVRSFAESCTGTSALERSGPFVIGGYGEVGKKVTQLLTDVGEQVRVIDRAPAEGVDQVGDILDHEVLENCGLVEAQALVLALDTDSATLFAAMMAKDYAPQTPVITRVNDAQNVERIHRAGADFALSISQVSGQMLAGRLLGQEAISLSPQLKVLKVTVDGLSGRHPSELRIRDRTGTSVVAVERGGELLVTFGPDFRFEEQDTVYIGGSSDATRRYLELFPQGS